MLNFLGVYQMNKRHNYKNTIESLKAKTVMSSKGCWIWTGCTTKDGYDRTTEWPKSISTHRLMYKLVNGEIPEGGHIMHLCDNPPCINPNHLKLGNHLENMIDMTNKGRRISLPGELNPSAKLTLVKVRKIREMLKQGIYAKEIAPAFGISMATVYHIKNGRIWNRGYEENIKYLEEL